MQRLFTRDQAQKLLPEVERLIRLAREYHGQYQQAERELDRFERRIQMLGGAQVDLEQVRSLHERKSAGAAGLKAAIESIHELGAQVKDLDLGLVDFSTLYRGREVLLCWKLGEPGIEYWHGLEEGYRGRQEIDREFLERHRGESAN